MNSFNKISILFISIFVSGFLLSAAPAAHATLTPVLSLAYTGSADNVTINVTGDPNATVLIFPTGEPFFSPGTTNANGTLSITVSSAQYSIAYNNIVYATTSGINGTESNKVAWPYIQSTTTASSLTLTQSALLLNVGQTSTITANVNSLYVLSNSTPSVANINLNANQITVTANTYGSTVANICALGSTTICQNVSITVQNSSAQQLTFNQNNFSIVSGQTSSVNVTGGSGVYTISNNSNPTSVQAYINGAIVTLTAQGTAGASSITVCTTDLSDCGIINVSSTALNSSAITLSQTNPVVPIGQSTTVTIYGGTSGSNFYVSSNSNPSIVQANVNSNILTLIGNASTGTSTISVCAYAGSCGTITATVSNTTAGGVLALSQSTISILAGQNSNITISGGSLPYTVNSSSPSIFQAAVNGNTLTIYGVNPGTGTANICASVGCTTLSVTINSTTTTSTNPPTFSQNNILLDIGQSSTVSVAGNGGFYIATNANSNIATAQISGSSIVISAVQAGADDFSICQTGGQCATLYVTVSGTVQSNSQITLSQSSLSLAVGQSLTISISGAGGYYMASNLNPNVASVNLMSTNIIVTALTLGNTTVSICQTGGQCASLYVVVSSTVNQPAALALSSATQSVMLGGQATFTITPTGFTNPTYTLSDSFAGTTAISADINSSGVFTWTPALTDVGLHSITVVATDLYGHSASTTAQISVSQAAAVAPAVTTTPSYVLPRYLGFGDDGADVLKLQQFLVQQGFLSATPNGHDGAATVAAIKKFQKFHGVNQTGNVGMTTKGLLDGLISPSASTTATTATKAQQVSLIQQMIQQLQAQLAALQ